jgi:ABC-type transporter Mla MlaB component
MAVNQGPRWATLMVPPQPGPVPGWPGHAATLIALSGTVGAADVAPLCAEVAELLAGSQPRLVVCDVGGLTGTGLAAVAALARLTLTAGRLGHRIQFRRVPRDVLELLVLAGLDEVLPIGTRAGEAAEL